MVKCNHILQFLSNMWEKRRNESGPSSTFTNSVVVVEEIGSPVSFQSDRSQFKNSEIEMRRTFRITGELTQNDVL